MNQLVPVNQNAVAMTSAPNNVPLGTAAWQLPGSGPVRTFMPGDFYMGMDQQNKFLGINDDTHISLNAATRGGKGASIIMQNLMMWQGSAVVIDPKGENAMVTARRRGGAAGPRQPRHPPQDG